jgi:hypothetical protein
MTAEHSPADDIVFDLVSIQYHALQSAGLHQSWVQDAEDHEDVVEFLKQVKDEDDRRAIRCHELLGALTKSGLS